MAERARDEDRLSPIEMDDPDPQSHTRQRKMADDLQLLMADFRGRARGLSGPALETEITDYLDRIIERNARMAPEAMRPEIRERLKEALAEDPTLQTMLASLRRAAAR